MSVVPRLRNPGLENSRDHDSPTYYSQFFGTENVKKKPKPFNINVPLSIWLAEMLLLEEISQRWMRFSRYIDSRAYGGVFGLYKDPATDLLLIWVRICDKYNICDGSNQWFCPEFYRWVEPVFWNSKWTVLLCGDTE